MKGAAKMPPEPHDASAPPAQSANPAQPAKAAVVITPEFGKRTQAQREADDRWFAALAEQSTGRISLPEITLPDEAEAPIETPGGSMHDDVAQDAPASPAIQEKAQLGETTDQHSPTFPEDQLREAASAQTAQQPDGQLPEPQGDQPEEQDAPLSHEPTPKPPSSLKRRVAVAVGIVLFIALIAAGLFYTWNRWYRFDDHADMQGQWYVVGTTVPVEIDETSIHLTPDVTYLYEINAQDKTIRYTFGPMEGQGRYWFSDNRQHLVITDGDQFTSTGTAVDDLLRQFEELIDSAQGNETALPEGEGIIAFCREPDAKALAKQQAEAEAKKKAEEEARKEEERRAAEEAAAAAAEYEEYYEEEPVAEEAPPEEPPVEDAQEGEEGGEG